MPMMTPMTPMMIVDANPKRFCTQMAPYATEVQVTMGMVALTAGSAARSNSSSIGLFVGEGVLPCLCAALVVSVKLGRIMVVRLILKLRLLVIGKARSQ